MWGRAVTEPTLALICNTESAGAKYNAPLAANGCHRKPNRHWRDQLSFPSSPYPPMPSPSFFPTPPPVPRSTATTTPRNH